MTSSARGSRASPGCARAKEWYHAQVAAFLFRPNAEMVAFGRELMANMDTSPAAGGVRRRRARRRSERRREWQLRGGAHPPDGQAHRGPPDGAAAPSPTLRSSSSRGATGEFDGAVASLRAFLGSEDAKTFSAMPPLLAPNGAYWIPSRYFVMDGSAGKKFHDIKQGNSRLGELYGGLEDEARRAGGASSAAVRKDEGMVLIGQILLMSGCEALLGSYSSNVLILVHDLMLARRVARAEPMHAMDVNGRQYCGCGASFCMNLERKTVREGGRSIKHVVDGFKY